MNKSFKSPVVILANGAFPISKIPLDQLKSAGTVICTDGSANNYKVLNINVTEQATGEITAGAGIGTNGTMFMLSVSENNWLGKGINLASSLEITEETISGSLAMKDPNFNYSGNAVYGNLNLSSTDKTSSSGYESSKTGFGLGTEFEQYENIFFSPALTATYEDIVVESSASSSMKKMEGSFTNLNFDYGITFDKRDQPFQPTSGYRSKFVQSLPLVVDSSSLMNGFDISTYHGKHIHKMRYFNTAYFLYPLVLCDSACVGL